MMPAYLYDVCPLVWRLLIYVCYLYYVFLPVQYNICTLNYVCLPAWCLLACIMSAYLYSVCCTVWCLSNCIDVCLFVWGLLDRSTARYFYKRLKTSLHKPRGNLLENLFSKKCAFINNLQLLEKTFLSQTNIRSSRKPRVVLLNITKIVYNHFTVP
jgi:hypothetical protein